MPKMEIEVEATTEHGPAIEAQLHHLVSAIAEKVGAGSGFAVVMWEEKDDGRALWATKGETRAACGALAAAAKALSSR